MFIKQFHIKSNKQLKESDLKKLRLKVKSYYSELDDISLLRLVPNKCNVSVLKLETNTGELVDVTSVNKRPMFFEVDRCFAPTLYTLWECPELLPYFTTYSAVLPKLANGAVLMLPGVIRQGTGSSAYGNYKKGQLVAVNLDSNKVAVGVGVLLKSSEELCKSNGGPCVKLLHVVGDKLWSIEPSMTLEIPKFGNAVETLTSDDFPELGQCSRKTKKDEPTITNSLSSLELESKLNDEEDSNEKNETECGESMDEILKDAFFTALKVNGEKLDLPMLTSNFYRHYILPSAKKRIDLKLTSYKKLSTFLQEMSQQEFIVTHEEMKGVQKITSVNLDHPMLNDITVDQEIASKFSNASTTNLFHLNVVDLYIVTEETLPFFKNLNFKKGDKIPHLEIKKLLKQYIIKNKLQYVDNDRKVLKCDENLMKIFKMQQGHLDNIIQTILSKMEQSCEMLGRNIIADKMPPIQIEVQNRAKNKKVSLVSNLESYGIIISEFVKCCKQKAAVGTSVVINANNKQQVQVQGNQTKFIVKLLCETYNISSAQIKVNTR